MPGRRRSLCAAVVGLALFAMPVGAQWGTNPLVAPSSWVDLPYVMVPVDGGVTVIQEGGSGQLELNRLDGSGTSVGAPVVWTDPDFPNGIGTGGNASLVGCKIEENLFALAYLIVGSRVRVVILRYDGSGGYNIEPGFPVTVGDPLWGTNSQLAITPNTTSAGIDGVLLAWQHADGSGPNVPVEVRQQGAYADASLVWTGATNGVLTWGPINLSSGLVEVPKIVSDGNGLAIVSYKAWYGGAVHHTTKLDSNGGVLWSITVPGSTGTTAPFLGECLLVGDGAGGAFYCFADDLGGSQTDLAVAWVEADGTGHSTVFWSSTPSSQLLRPLAAVATPDKGVFLAYRDLTGIRAVKFGSDPSFSLLLATFLQGATADNSEEAAGVMGPDHLAFVWTRSDELVVSKALHPMTGEAIWGENNEFRVNSNRWNTPQAPRVLATNCGFVYGWYDPGVSQGGILADVVTNGVLGMFECGWYMKYCFGDGSGSPCPMGNHNDGSNGQAGCANSWYPGGAQLSASGGGSISGVLVLEGSQLPPFQPGLYYQGNNATNGGQGVAFGNGLRCASGGIMRLQIAMASGGGTSQVAIVGGAGAAPGDVKRYQLWYRDPMAGFSGFNLTNGIELTWTP